jgi:hypothetical protein
MRRHQATSDTTIDGTLIKDTGLDTLASREIAGSTARADKRRQTNNFSELSVDEMARHWLLVVLRFSEMPAKRTTAFSPERKHRHLTGSRKIPAD